MTAAVLRTPATIRERCGNILAFVAAGESPHFTLARSQLPAVAERVAALTRQRFPDGRIPLHSRWRHFEAGGVDRKAQLDACVRERSPVGVARARIDLALVSVLLDAGAGPDWRYTEPGTGLQLGRSEGLGVASFHAFLAGRFSSEPGDRCRVDAKALLRVDGRWLADIFQAGEHNPIVGLDGRAALLRRLGEALRARPDLFTAEGLPGHLFDALTHHSHVHHLPHANLHHPRPTAYRHHVSAARILQTLLEAFSAIWPSGQQLPDGTPLGDVWRHPAGGGEGASAGWVPFHKLSQWLTYSLIEPYEWAGVQVGGLDALTGLPEYRNGGLLLDAGVIVPRDAGFAAAPRQPGDEWVIEWRALTVALLDELAPLVRERLQAGADGMPLARILEGGTWAAGRQIAQERRGDGSPPVRIQSDGTVF
ncbi:URC4/urg3 family protein [Ideonella sp. BN130291]|uniref:URC4/urg3 family protein n=1 Tax=Ideonella sp. BN130291 TaxID=3112940 RepID=UPI002E25FC6B|nr:URC4/urg3 family protein [Ideonella sp. BN130291]